MLVTLMAQQFYIQHYLLYNKKKTFKNKNLKQIARAEVVAGITNAVQQTPNRNINVITPIFGASPTTLGTAGAPVNGQAAPQPVGVNPYAGKRNS